MVRLLDKGKSPTPVNPETRWIRLQEIGLAQFLALPFVPLLDYVIEINTFNVLIFLALGTSGYCCLRYGYDKRRELKDQEDDCSKCP